VLIVKENNNRTWFLKASKKKAKESEDERLVHSITEAISARRHKDLLDLLARIEQSSGWSTVIDYLIKVDGKTYSSNMGLEGPEVTLEPLKFREVIFNLFHCRGLEPAKANLIALLEKFSHESSIADAIHGFSQEIEKLVWNQIKKNDLLFFNPPYDNTWITDDLKNTISEYQRKEVSNLVLWKSNDKINIEPLWYTELGRQALSSIGSQGFFISTDELSQVITVIQVSPKPQPKILSLNNHKTQQYELVPPSHPDYKLLLNSIIEMKSHTLGYLGSKHAIPTLDNILYDNLRNYEVNPSSNNYQQILNKINCHIAIRDLNSIPILEQLSQFKDERIAIIAIIALGNFYHESAALALIDVICNKKNNEIIRKSLDALENLCNNYPETIAIIEDALEVNCTNYGKFKKLYKKIKRK
jgi:hypothetical protein